MVFIPICNFLLVILYKTYRVARDRIRNHYKEIVRYRRLFSLAKFDFVSEGTLYYSFLQVILLHKITN